MPAHCDPLICASSKSYFTDSQDALDGDCNLTLLLTLCEGALCHKARRDCHARHAHPAHTPEQEARLMVEVITNKLGK